jgi:hypothetical protein
LPPSRSPCTEEDKKWRQRVEEYREAPASDLSRRKNEDKKRDANLKKLYEMFADMEPRDYLKRVAKWL